MREKLFAPGCALMLYKPHLAEKFIEILNLGERIEGYYTCCKNELKVRETTIINTCAGCDRRFREGKNEVDTISLWEIISESETFPFPNYQGRTMTIHDACPTRSEERVHIAIRKLLKRMNIHIIEPENTKESARCCGDSFYGKLPKEKVYEQMQKRALEMPNDDVVVYCVSCIKAFFHGGKKPRYLMDLLCNEATIMGTLDLELWHKELDDYRSKN